MKAEKVNYAIKLIKEELKKGSLSLNADSNISSLTDEAVESDISTASTNVTSGSKSSLESKASNPARKRGLADNNTSHKRSKIYTSAIDYGSRKKIKLISSKNTVLTPMQLDNQKALPMKVLESFLNVLSR
jgi:hypothetical protein